MTIHNVGIESIKTTEYRDWEAKLRKLVDKRESADVLHKFNDYMAARDAYYSLMLFIHFHSLKPETVLGAPPKLIILFSSLPKIIKKKLECMELAFIESIAGTYREGKRQ